MYVCMYVCMYEFCMRKATFSYTYVSVVIELHKGSDYVPTIAHLFTA